MEMRIKTRDMIKMEIEAIVPMKRRHDIYNIGSCQGHLFFLHVFTAIFVMILFLTPQAGANPMDRLQMGAQLTDTKTLVGTLSARFNGDYDDVDLYVIAYAASENLSIDKDIFSLESVENGWGWRRGVSLVGSHDCIKAGKWITLTDVDFSPFRESLSKTIVLTLLVNKGEDPLEWIHWMDVVFVTLVTDPRKRMPGQTLFFSDGDMDREYPVYLDAPTADAGGDGEKEDDQNIDNASVEKPDIYKIAGNRIYYANGSADRFQVVDISLPDNPRMIYSRRLENTPLDIYLNEENVILLEQAADRDTVAIVLKVFQDNGDNIQEVARENYSNLNYLNSRKSGDRIFITATHSGVTGGTDILAEPDVFPDGDLAVGDDVPGTVGDDLPDSGALLEPMTLSPVMEQRAVVMAVDMANPETPALIARQTFSGYDSDIYLDGDYLVQIARESWQTTVLHVFNLGGETDILGSSVELKIPGRVPSEYHVKISDNTLFVIYRHENIKRGSALGIYDLASSGEVVEKGIVEGIAPGEELYAATFMDERAYIVTYEKTDPLWVVDISDHESPKILGELEVPGWSEYIRFHNNRLIALGYDDSDGRRLVSIALFSVEDPLNPVLLDRVTPLRDVADYTSSVAISDDRGFYFNMLSGLILVPIEYYASRAYSYHGHSGLGIVRIDADYNKFQWEHFFEAGFRVNRGTEAQALNDIIVSMGDSALNTVDISSPAVPVLRGELRLAFNVEKIALSSPSGSNGPNNNSDDGFLLAVGGDYYLNESSDLMFFNLSKSFSGNAGALVAEMDIQSDSKGKSVNIQGANNTQDMTLDLQDTALHGTPDTIIDSGIAYPDIVISSGVDG
ncbi:MAG: beta-propeller domain-containing protein, partial [Desulfamplus sp.]|nr:beta-propeller domain-containing protein [Desulfamplus sp.]